MGWLWAGYQLSLGWLLVGYQLAIGWLSAGYQLAISWLSVTIGWLGANTNTFQNSHIYELLQPCLSPQSMVGLAWMHP